MDIAVKNTVLAKTYISKFAYNPIKNILACNIDGNDTIQFFFVENNLSFSQLFEGQTKPAGSKSSLSWSPDGNYLALGASKIQVWQIKENRLRPYKSFNQDFIEIKSIQWSVDSNYYACGGISITNTIKIRTIQNGKMRELKLPQQLTMSAISFDPYGKYMFVLLRNNCIQVYNTSNFQKQKQINLTPKHIKFNPIKQVRIASWSPNFNTFVCPSLDDSRLSVAFSFTRTNDFKLRNVYLGHFSSINCCKFNPRLYSFNNQICSILAMGDSNGTISVWRVSQNNTYQQPLLMSYSLQNSMQVAQELQWSQDGSVLLINMMKQYVNVIKFKKQNFGVELSDQQIANLIQQSYGSKSANDIDKQNIQIFSGSSFEVKQNLKQKIGSNLQISKKEIINQKTQNIQYQNKNIQYQSKKILVNTQKQIDKLDQKMQIQQKSLEKQNQAVYKQPGQVTIIDNSFQNEINQQNKQQQISQEKVNVQIIKPKDNIQIPKEKVNVENQFKEKVEYMKISEQKTIITKDNKKKIQPSVMIRKDQFNKDKVNNAFSSNNFQPQFRLNNVQPQRLNNQRSNQIIQQKYLPSFTNLPIQTVFPLKLKVIELSKKQYLLGEHKILSIQRLTKFSVVEIKQIQTGIKIAQRTFNGVIDHIQVSNDLIYILNNGMLYVVDHQFNFEDLPLKTGYLHKFVVTNSGDLYYLNCDGYVYGFNFYNKKCFTSSPIPIHFILKNNLAQDEKLDQLAIHLNDKIKQFFIGQDHNLYIEVDNEKYLFGVQTGSWIKVEICGGVLKEGLSVKVTEKQQILCKSFLANLCPILVQKQNKIASKNVNSSVMLPYQCDLVYYKKYNPNCKQFQNSFLALINYLTENNKTLQLRNLIYRYFYNKNSKVYIGKGQFYQKIKRFGGKIIDQFQLNSIFSLDSKLNNHNSNEIITQQNQTNL